MSKVILISQVPLPYSKIGSWTTLYNNYLINEHAIDYIVCEQPDFLFEGVEYGIVANTFTLKLQKRFFKKTYLGYLEAVDKIIKKDQKFIIQIIDNFGIVRPLVDFLEKTGRRKQCYLQFFYHGFPPFYGNLQSRWFFENIDEMVLLTHDSYQEHKKYYTILPTRFSVLHNGIDTTKFSKLIAADKTTLKNKLGVQDKTVFVWCSQDRPKKGLHLILDAWKKVHNQNPNTILWIIGCEPKEAAAGVHYLGRIPNGVVATYLQASDCFLFPTLCHEGFGLSLIEALNCGNFCIASSIGGVPEVLQYGKLGKLIENPHFVTDWEEAILEFLDNSIQGIPLPVDLYSSTSWNIGMNSIIENAKKSL